MKKNNLAKDVIRIINELLANEITLKDAQNWLKKHPCLKNKHCSRNDIEILKQLRCLLNKPFNENQWRDFQDYLK